MASASTSTRIRPACLNNRRLIGAAVASIALVAQICPVAAAEDFAAPSSYSLIPVQLAMGRRVPVNAPPAKKPASAPVKTQGAITKEEDRRLTEAFNRMTPKERKRLAKAMKGLNPEERRQVAEAMKRQLAGQPTASPATKRGR